MSHVVCLLNVEADRATFSWAEGPASFEPYTLDGLVYKEFKQTAEAARERLADLIKDYLYGVEHVPQGSFALAEAGYEVYEALFDPGADQKRQASQVRKWLEKLAQQHEVDTLEIVFESPWTLPWNVIYDQEPDEDEFLKAGGSPDRWRPFWGLRYNLCGGRKVDPLRRMPVLIEPKVLMVVDTEIRDGLPEAQRQRLAAFADEHGLTMVHTKRELKAATKAQRPDLLYWLSHAEPDALVLSDEPVSPRDLRKLLKQDDDEDLGFGGLAFLNACQTAEGSREEGSFFEAFHSVGFAGMIGTEQQTIDQFANPLGLDFLEAFLERGESVGAVLRQLRARVPLGLLYGTYCPPNIRVQQDSGRDTVDIDETLHVTGRTLRGEPAAVEPVAPLLPPLPPEPYRSLAYYEREDRALFAGRDDDIERFATLLDDAGTRLLVLHGEAGVGKSSFLHAGAIPFLEEECVGYRFLRALDDGDGPSAELPGSVLFFRATNDLFGQLAHALCDLCGRPYEYRTPLGESVSADLPALLRELVGCEVTQVTVRALLRVDVSFLGRILAALSDRLPFSPILVIDQAEEVFTLARKPEDHVRGRRAVEMLRQTIHAGGDFKVVLSMRTEYYGRIIDRLRRGSQDTLSVREYLLTDFDEESLVDAILRPTNGEQIPHTPDIPFVKYGFQYADGVAEDIAHRVVRYTAQRRDSVLPLMQVICAQLYRLARRRADTTISIEDLEGLGGIEGGMREHVEGLLDELLEQHPRDKKPLHKLFTQLYLKQPDGTLTTALLPEEEVRRRWTGRMGFAELLESALSMRLLKVNTLRIGFDKERRYVSLGHDSLAKLAADWDEELSRGARMRKMVRAIGIVSTVAVVMAMLAMWAVVQGRLARDSEKAANISERRAIDALEEAEANLTKAVEAVDRYFTVVSEDTLLNQAGTQKLRQQLLSDAKVFLEGFAEKYAGNSQVKESVAKAHFNLGRIYEEVDSEFEVALASYGKARPIQEDLAEPIIANPKSSLAGTEAQANADRLASLGNTLIGMGRAHTSLVKSQSDTALAVVALDEIVNAIKFRKLLSDYACGKPPGSQEEFEDFAMYQRRLADAIMNLGLLKQKLEYRKIVVSCNEEVGTPLDHFEASQKLRDDLLRQMKARKGSDQYLKVLRERARGFYNLAKLFDRCARAIGGDVQASELLGKCGMDDDASQVAEFESRLEAAPDDAEAQRHLDQAKTRYGNFLAKRGTDYFDLAIDDYETVIAKTPNDFDAHRDLAQTHILNGRLVFEYQHGGGQTGLELISQAKVRMGVVVKLNPEVVSYRVTLGWACDELGVHQMKYAVARQMEDDPQITSDRLREARESLLEAIEILKDCPSRGTARAALDEARGTLGQVEDLLKTSESVNDS